MPIKDRTNDFRDYAWEIARQNNCASEVAAIENALKVGYKMGIKDATELLSGALEGLKQDRADSNKPK